ncbi:unnamed protein product [Calicophoron daubneyi]|uniref:Uncharacterized protein n=1 Tax=Calicophoron daubneyi TaxID=300641 RepID=A0AAV2TDD5_CALDB
MISPTPSHPDDVLSALGSPSRIFYKTEDKMKIHLPQSYRLEQPRRSDYFYNYLTMGLDILFDARTHQVIKFVLHTNQPGEYTFNTYYRCLFEIPLPYSDESTENKATGAQNPDGSAPKSRNVLIVTPFLNWSAIQRCIGPDMDHEPVVIYRDSKPGRNPFGPTHTYGYRDIIFEVIPDCDLLASVTLYTAIRPPSGPDP